MSSHLQTPADDATAAKKTSGSKGGKYKDITDRGTMSSSSANPGSGLFNITSENLEIYWETQGVKPHWCAITFKKPQLVSYVRIIADHARDSSYQPEEGHLLIKKTAVGAGEAAYHND